VEGLGGLDGRQPDPGGRSPRPRPTRCDGGRQARPWRRAGAASRPSRSESVEKSRTLLIADQILRNAAMAVPELARWRARRGRTATTARQPGPRDLQRYAYAVFDLVVEAVGPERLADARVVEIGPGDHAPAALLFLAAGARSYAAVDRFPGDLGGAAGRRFYEALARDLEVSRPALAARLRDRGVGAADLMSSGLVEVIPCAVEQWRDRDAADVLVSHNAVEHLSDLAAFAKNSYASVRPGGVAVHRVDFDAHDAWASREDPFEWLTVSERLWHLMGSRRGCPNRARHHEVLENLEKAGWRIDSRVLDAFEPRAIEAARPRLARRFRSMPIDSLRVRTALLVCHKP